ncbi:MAG: hypothetical protein EXS05_18380 [Planctomycetaceae bacterium]|nr:hypothetical protein [Planctomycetaceae bacterium]
MERKHKSKDRTMPVAKSSVLWLVCFYACAGSAGSQVAQADVDRGKRDNVPGVATINRVEPELADDDREVVDCLPEHKRLAQLCLICESPIRESTRLALKFAMPIYRQQVAIREIERLGGRFKTRPSGPDWLRAWFGDERMKMLDELVGVDFMRTRFTDAEMIHLCSLIHLEWLNLARTQVTDAGLIHLAQLPRLQMLSLGGTEVTDAGLVHLSKLTKLTFLILSSTPITDVGLDHLKKIANLEVMCVEKTQLTNSGLRELEKTLPNVLIEKKSLCPREVFIE